MSFDQQPSHSPSQLQKALLVLETVICFGPAAFWTLALLLLAPHQLSNLFSSVDGEARTAALMVASAFGAILGLVAVANTLAYLLGARSVLLSSRLAITFCIAGIATLLVWFMDCIGANCSKGWLLVFLLPLVATVHFVWAARGYLFRGHNNQR